MSPMFPLSPLGTAQQKTQLPWDVAQPYKGLGFRAVHARPCAPSYGVKEVSLA